MKKIIFTKEELVNLEFSLNREILRASSSSGFASTTLCCCNTRKYHGLLIVPMPEIDNENHVILSSIDETVLHNDYPFNLAIHRFPNDTYYPKGHKYLERYELIKIPKHTYRVADILLTKEMIYLSNQDRLIIKYTIEEANNEVKLQLSPFLAFRQVHKLSKANSLADATAHEIENGEAFRLYENYDFVNLQFSKEVRYVHNPLWYYNFEYIKEAERGYDSHEDLLTPGCFEVQMQKGESLYFTASMQQIDAKDIERLYQEDIAKRDEIITMEDALKRAAKMFFVEKGEDADVIAGFPWFGRWGRDTFISLPGLCIGLDDRLLFKKVIDTMIKDMKGGLFPNIGQGSDCAYNSVDAPMWFFWALQQYSDFIDDRRSVWQDYKEVMIRILESYRNGTSANIRMLDNGLIWAAEEGKALTWMDAVVEGVPVTQRKGMCVEINALWYNAIMFSLELAKEAKEEEFINSWQELADMIPISFKNTFWCKMRGTLADCVDGYYQDFSVRPNMIFATSLKYSPISSKIKQLIVDKVRKELLTPFGLRTLSPTHPDYKDYYFGDQSTRDKAYHQGTVWPWLLGHFIEGYLKVYDKSAIGFAENIYNGFEKEIINYGLGSIAEVFDGNPPHQSGGSISQAWSVSEVLRIKYLIDKYK